ncbi:NAD(P)-dependent oxidoreductase [Actinoplanes sp. NBRC 14428]|uniref:NAD(P)H dehydrogenase (Quinone) n=1 Tax=Pseudosporangium ferrugineum TaxID=439699 RepID=A0A2T0S0Z9_9ACTN|nr:SDR family oxidoreductase [Pseudosporangium ferrugineum]PRY27108.1 NAD(P)H dehydrogenase (quinone) [Pseudosporangium ferrugineum]BCJ53155.1 NAD(P)-dependent oxidoreductase [Actinoplanes sp. NBRC 14428]
MTIVVTGATGHLGRLAVESLIGRGVPAAEIVAIGRSVEKIQDLADRGVVVKQASYDEPDTLREAFAGADKLLFVSASEPGKRIQQHTNVIEAAKEAGIGKVVYTSIPRADTSPLILASEHRVTEQALTESGVPSVFVRNSWYLENYDLKGALEHGLYGAAGEGKISIATRADYAEAAAAAVLTDDEQRVYELGGEGVTLAELAAVVSQQSGREVAYTDLGPEKYTEFLVSVGVPEGFAAILADSDKHAAEGALHTGTEDIEKLLGRPVTPLAQAVAAALA